MLTAIWTVERRAEKFAVSYFTNKPKAYEPRIPRFRRESGDESGSEEDHDLIVGIKPFPLGIIRFFEISFTDKKIILWIELSAEEIPFTFVIYAQSDNRLQSG